MISNVSNLNNSDGNTVKENKVTSKKEGNNKDDITDVPVVEKKEEKDLEAPIEGYHIEKSETVSLPDDDGDDDDDEMDTNIHPEERITLKSPSIALNLVSNELTSALDQAVSRASNSGVEDEDKTDTFFTQAQTLSEDNDPNAIFKLNFDKKFNIYGKAVYDYTNYRYSDTDIGIKMTQSSQKFEIGGTFLSKSGRTKGVFLGSANKSTVSVTTNISESLLADLNINDEDVELSDEQDLNADNLNEPEITTAGIYNLYVAGQHTFKNGDILTSNAFYHNDGVQEASTTSANADYYLSKYGAHISAGTTWYKGQDDVSTQKTYFNCTFNPEEYENIGQETPTDESTENVTDTPSDTSDTTDATDTKDTKAANNKWKRSLSPFFDTQAIEGSPEEGLGIKVRFKKLEQASSTRIGMFGKVSTTQRGDESSLYHLTAGVGARYITKVGHNGVIKAEADLRDKYTFGNGNILTATGNFSYVVPKFSAEVEGMYIAVPHSSYAGVVGRLSYTPNKNVHAYAEASYLNWKYPEGKIDGSSLNLGVLVNF